MRSLRLTPQMEEVIELIAKEAKCSEKRAINKLFALAKVVYTNTSGPQIIISEPYSDSETVLKGVRHV